MLIHITVALGISSTTRPILQRNAEPYNQHIYHTLALCVGDKIYEIQFTSVVCL